MLTKNELTKKNALYSASLLKKVMMESIVSYRGGKTTKEIDYDIGVFFKENGLRSAPQVEYDMDLNFCSSRDEVVCHGWPSDDISRPGESLDIDISFASDHYADMAFTVPYTEHKIIQRLNKVIFDGMAGLKKVIRPGATIKDLVMYFHEYLSKFDDVGYYSQLSGHYINTKLHASPHVPYYHDERLWGQYYDHELCTGDVFCFEPLVFHMIKGDKKEMSVKSVTLPSSDNRHHIVGVKTRFNAHMEHMYMVTDSGCECITDIDEDFLKKCNILPN